MRSWICAIWGHDWVQLRWAMKSGALAQHRCRRCGKLEYRLPKGG